MVPVEEGTACGQAGILSCRSAALHARYLLSACHALMQQAVDCTRLYLGSMCQDQSVRSDCVDCEHQEMVPDADIYLFLTSAQLRSRCDVWLAIKASL